MSRLVDTGSRPLAQILLKNQVLMMKKIIGIALLMLLIAQSSFAALKINDRAPEFTLRDRSNGQVSLADLIAAGAKGKGKGLVLGFFASWCLQCRNELPLLNSLVGELNAKGIRVAMIGVREDFATIEALLKELKVDKPVILSDPTGKTSERYQVRFLPVTFFIGSDGLVKGIIFGEIQDASELRISVEKLVQ